MHGQYHAAAGDPSQHPPDQHLNLTPGAAGILAAAAAQPGAQMQLLAPQHLHAQQAGPDQTIRRVSESNRNSFPVFECLQYLMRQQHHT